VRIWPVASEPKSTTNWRVILITGANGGIGGETSRAFLAESASNFVWLGVHSKTSEAEQLVVENPNRCALVSLNVTQAESWKRAVDQIISAHQRLDVLVNNAGGQRDALLGTMTDEAWANVREVNLDAVFFGCRAVLPAMIAQRRGRIINVASLSALAAPPGQTNYAAAKAGVVALTRSLSKEVARIGITINAVCPGYIDTDAMAGFSEEERKAALARIPMRRFGRAEEVAAAIRFLACSEASYITGSVLKIDGGIF